MLQDYTIYITGFLTITLDTLDVFTIKKILSNCCWFTSQMLAIMRGGPRTQHFSFGWQRPQYSSCQVLLQHALAGSWSTKWIWNLHPGTITWDACDPNAVLTLCGCPAQCYKHFWYHSTLKKYFLALQIFQLYIHQVKTNMLIFIIINKTAVFRCFLNIPEITIPQCHMLHFSSLSISNEMF